MIAAITGGALIFAVAGWLGTELGARLSAGYLPFDDVPASNEPRRWWFVAFAAGAGAAIASHETALPLVALAVVTVALSACAFSDVRAGIVPDVFTIVPLIAILLLAMTRHDPAPWIGAAVVAVPLGVAAFVSRGAGMGWGDVKLAAVVGALLGARDATLAILAACAAAYVIAMVRRRVKQPVPFAPYLAAAVAIAFVAHRLD